MGLIEWLALYIVIWFVCGFISAGFEFAYFQGEWPEIAEMDLKKDSEQALIALLCGPGALICTLSCRRYKYGWRLWVKGRE